MRRDVRFVPSTDIVQPAARSWSKRRWSESAPAALLRDWHNIRTLRDVSSTLLFDGLRLVETHTIGCQDFVKCGVDHRCLEPAGRCWAVLMRQVCRANANEPQGEAQLPRSNVQPMETTMQKTALTIFGALLISGMAVQMATATEHQGRKAYFGRDHDRSVLHRAYNQVNGPIDATPRTLDRFDQSDWRSDPKFSPTGN